MRAEWNLIVAVVAARHGESQVVENTLAKAMHEREPVRRRKIDPRLPLLGAIFLDNVRQNPDLHGLSPCASALRVVET